MERENLYIGAEERDLYVWVDPLDDLVRHNAGLIGTFVAGPIGGLDDERSDNRIFIPNPDFSGHISPFQLGLVRSYIVEFHLELARRARFSDYPSRLDAAFLLPTAEAAVQYARSHCDHVRGRRLKRVRTVGRYKLSVHDPSWIDFARLPHSLDEATWDEIGEAYWTGVSTPTELQSMGRPWSAESGVEVLYYGRVDFTNRDLASDDVDLGVLGICDDTTGQV